MSRAAGLHEPLGKLPFHETVPAYPLPHAQAGPASMFEKETLQAAGLHDPLGKLPFHETVPAYPLPQAQAGPGFMFGRCACTLEQ